MNSTNQNQNGQGERPFDYCRIDIDMFNVDAAMLGALAQASNEADISILH